LRMNSLQVIVGRQFGAVDEFVAGRASAFHAFQQDKHALVLAVLNLKDFRGGYPTRAPSPEPDSSPY
ncbi:MAG TPA: hypothetical protein VFD87_07745, partial [Phototrophicaceae bacterium]|nr:hypothetical protein [Phototrophicaceae bacterium]